MERTQEDSDLIGRALPSGDAQYDPATLDRVAREYVGCDDFDHPTFTGGKDSPRVGWASLGELKGEEHQRRALAHYKARSSQTSEQPKPDAVRAVADEAIRASFEPGAYAFEVMSDVLKEMAKDINVALRPLRDDVKKWRSDEKLGAASLKLFNAMDTRVRRCENGLMPMADSPFNTNGEVKALKALVERQAETIASLQRQASRHATHLQNLEDKAQGRR